MENTTVENPNVTETMSDDAAFMSEVTEEQDMSESLESVLDQSADNTEETTTAQENATPSASEPGWIRKRVDKAVAKAIAETEQRLTAQYEARFAPLQAQLIENEAKELVRSGEFKSIERAREYLQLKGGVTPTQPQQTDSQQQPRDEQGRFQKQTPQEDPAVRAQAEMLMKQAAKIKASRGLDVMAEYQTNDEAREKILSGEWDFYDLAESMAKAPKKRAPSPTRSPNGASSSDKSTVASMSKEEFDRLEKGIASGTRYQI